MIIYYVKPSGTCFALDHAAIAEVIKDESVDPVFHLTSPFGQLVYGLLERSDSIYQMMEDSSLTEFSQVCTELRIAHRLVTDLHRQYSERKDPELVRLKSELRQRLKKIEERMNR